MSATTLDKKVLRHSLRDGIAAVSDEARKAVRCATKPGCESPSMNELVELALTWGVKAKAEIEGNAA